MTTLTVDEVLKQELRRSLAVENTAAGTRELLVYVTLSPLSARYELEIARGDELTVIPYTYPTEAVAAYNEASL